jgi:hypothetical protein
MGIGNSTTSKDMIMMIFDESHPDEEIIKLFRKYNKNKDKYLQPEEFNLFKNDIKLIIKKLETSDYRKINLLEKLADFSSIDQNSDDLVSYLEFKNHLTKLRQQYFLKNEYKVVLLSGGSSGKSTIFKNLYSQQNKFSVEELRDYSNLIYKNILEFLLKMYTDLKNNNIIIKDENAIKVFKIHKTVIRKATQRNREF